MEKIYDKFIHVLIKKFVKIKKKILMIKIFIYNLTKLSKTQF